MEKLENARINDLETAKKLINKLENELLVQKEIEKTLNNKILEKHQLREKVIRKLSEVSELEKINFYDDVFNDAIRILGEMENDCTDYDKQYPWEKYMSVIAKPGTDFLNYFNSLC